MYRRLANEDAEKLAIPHICLFSKEDGSPEAVADYKKILQKGEANVVEQYATMPHGWMGARGLGDEEVVKEFERG